MKNALSVIAGTLFYATAGTVSAGASSMSECRSAVVSEKEFESRGGKLTVLSPLRLSDIPSSCTDGMVMIFFVFADGSVSEVGFDRYSLFDGGACGALMSKRIQAMRYERPLLKKKPVCVELRREFSSQSPRELFRRTL
jgi:hypothetical protein